MGVLLGPQIAYRAPSLKRQNTFSLLQATELHRCYSASAHTGLYRARHPCRSIERRELGHTVALILFLDGAHTTGWPAAPHGARAGEVLRQLAQLVHVVRAQLGQDAGQELMQLCVAQGNLAPDR